MATRERQCAYISLSPFTQLAKAFSFPSSLPLITFMQLISVLLFAFLSLANSEPSSYSSVAASSSQIYTLHDQEELSITKPFIYETVAASSPPAGSLIMHANFPQKKEALILDDGQDHASKEKAPTSSTPGFIYESVAASFSSRSRAESSHLHDNELLRDAEAAIVDDGGKHLPSTAKPSYIYESVAASLSQKSHGSTLLRENALQEENAFLLDDGIGKKEVTKPSYIYESVIAASTPSRHPSDGSILHNNVPQEENGFLHDDGTNNPPIVVKKEDPIIAKPSYIYESVAASMHPEVRDAAIRNSVPQGEKGFLLDDGGKHVEDVKKGAKPITGKQFIYEYVVSQSHMASHPAGGSHLHNNVAQEENYSLLADDSKHAHIKEDLLQDNVPQPDNVLLLDDGGKHVHESPAAAVASTQDGGKLLQDNVPQEKYVFLRDNGRRKPISSNHHDEALLIDTKLKEGKSQSLHDIDVKESLNVQENKVPAKALDSLLHDNVPQGKHAYLVDDGSIKLEKKLPIYHKLRLARKHSFNEENLRMVVGPQPATGGDDGSYNEEILRMVEDNSSNKIIHEEHPMTATRIDDPQNGNLRMVVDNSTSNLIEMGSRAHDNKGNSNEENLRMVVGDSSSNMAHKGDGVEGSSPNEESLKMVVGDSSNNMIQSDSSKSMVQEVYGSPSKLKMVVDDDTSNNMIKKGPFSAGRGRSRTCATIAVCQELAHAEHLVRIALYGQLPGSTALKNAACCGALCVDLDTDLLNCGTCGVACGLLQTCCSGKCTDLNTDSSNCGQCGHSCASANPCQFGMCGYY